MKFEYQKKVASLNKHKKRGANFEAFEKAKAAVSHLHKRGPDELEQYGIEDKPQNDLIAEKQFATDVLKKRLEEVAIYIH